MYVFIIIIIIIIFYLFLVTLVDLIISDPDDEPLQVVQKDLIQCINELWDKLPIDTVIASILDPRTKWYSRIPKAEIAEALKEMKKVC